ncbi:MAG: hypothetical protein KDD25_02405 [Bdellovibrionales bacterium]|nr:hypothetical protein [Bdellovibrionales bacterium]
MDRDDFEFKPINEGLGFHKKVIDLKDETSGISVNRAKTPKEITQAIFQRDKDIFQSVKDPSIRFYEEDDRASFDNQDKYLNIKERIESKKSELERSESLRNTIERQDESLKAKRNAFGDPVDQLAEMDVKKASRLDESRISNDVQEELNEILQRRERAVAPQISPILLDLFVVIGLAAIFAVPLLMITQVDPIVVIRGALKDVTIQASLAILFIAVVNFYLIVSRSFFSSTLGEWAFDLKLGTLKQRKSILYPFKVLTRCLIMTATGLLVLPFLGWIIRKDLLGKLTGTQLTSEY